jgi:hypothetical protein
MSYDGRNRSSGGEQDRNDGGHARPLRAPTGGRGSAKDSGPKSPVSQRIGSGVSQRPTKHCKLFAYCGVVATRLASVSVPPVGHGVGPGEPSRTDRVHLPQTLAVVVHSRQRSPLFLRSRRHRSRGRNAEEVAQQGASPRRSPPDEDCSPTDRGPFKLSLAADRSARRGCRSLLWNHGSITASSCRMKILAPVREVDPWCDH